MEAVFPTVAIADGSHGITVGHPQMRHLIQRCTSDQHLCRLPRELPGAHSLAEDHFHSEHLRLGQTSPMVATFLLPLPTPNFADAPHVLIANQPLPLAVAVLPNLGILARRDDRLRAAPPDRLIAVALVIRAKELTF
jgi:hypothetical protein